MALAKRTCPSKGTSHDFNFAIATRTLSTNPTTRQFHSKNDQGPVNGRELSPQIAKGTLQCAE
jgi:hypothetical protein